ncbi:MAG: hypothetical protein H0W72_08395 [Planctomycetes bacterium]|nr:hypothetical protein [Planctomycetota bacterium]
MPLPTPAIGSLVFPTNFADWESLQPLEYSGLTVTVYFQDGVNGAGAMYGSKRPQRGLIRTLARFATQALAAQALIDYETLKDAGLVTVVDEFGRTWTGCICERIDKRIIPEQSPTTYYAAEAVWSFIPPPEVPTF